MRIAIFTIFGLILTNSAIGSAQDVVPPPGFSPAGDLESTINPPTAPNTFTRDPDLSPRWPVPDRGNLPSSDRPGLHPFETAPPPPVPTAMPFPTVWLTAEALAWWTKGSPVPVPLVTDGGPLGSGSSVLLGNQVLGLPLGGGGRLTLGAAISDDQRWALEGSYFYLRNGSVSRGVSSDGGPASSPLAFPFYNPLLPGEDSSPIATPGAFAGTAFLSTRTLLQGLDANVLYNVQGSGNLRFDLLAGFRTVNVQENLVFTTDSPNVFPNPPAFFHTFDAFDTKNNFYGGQIGGRASFDDGRLFFNAGGKLAIGDMIECVAVNGGTFTNVGGGYSSSPGAYLSQPTNIGTQSTSRFAFIPELNLNLGVQLTPWARVKVGYTFLYVNSVARPGDQIDRVINPAQAPAITGNDHGSFAGPARPSLTIHDTNLWTQGLNLGLEFRF